VVIFSRDSSLIDRFLEWTSILVTLEEQAAPHR
jgi:hypothetical protein